MSSNIQSQNVDPQQDGSQQITLADVDDQLRSLQPAATHPNSYQQQAAVAAAAAANQPQAQYQQQYYNSQQYFPYLPQDQAQQQQQQLAPASPQQDKSKRTKRSIRATTSNDSIKKCSRCRVKRLSEDQDMLNKYATCISCRMKRKVKHKKARTPSKLPNLSDDWGQYQEKVSMNTSIDLYQHNYRNYTDENIFPRYQRHELNPAIVRDMSALVVSEYIAPLELLTGFKFAIRDHHKPNLQDPNPNKCKKITWMYICSQDKYRQRKSRSENKRQVVNKLKTEECDSKITINYDLVTGIIQLSYNHKHHQPFNWKKDTSHEDMSFQLQQDHGDHSGRYLPSKDSDVTELSKLLKQEAMDTNEIVALATRAAAQTQSADSATSANSQQQPQEQQQQPSSTQDTDQLYEMQLLQQQQQQLAQQAYQQQFQQQNYQQQQQEDSYQQNTSPTTDDNVDDELKYHQQSSANGNGGTNEDVIDHELIRESTNRQ